MITARRHAEVQRVLAAIDGVNAIEIDGDPARQDLDHTLARHVAHARPAAIPADRIVNGWPLERLLGWLRDSASECGR